MQQPQSRPLLGDSVSSTTSPNARRNSSVAVLTQQQLQQLQLQAQNTSGQSLTFALQQTSNTPQDQGNGSTTGNHIVYVNQLNQLNQSTINPSGTGMGLPPATPTFGVGLNMGLPLSLLNTSLTSLTSNVITTTNPLLNLGLPSINTGLATINPSLNQLNAINSNIGSNNINNGLSNLGQDLSSINAGISTGISNTLNSTNINSGLSGVSTGLSGVSPNLANLSSPSINQNLTTLNTNLSAANSGVSGLPAINPNASLTSTSINSGLNQGLSRPANALATAGLTPTTLNSSNTQFPFQTIQSIQTVAPHIVGSSNLAHVPSSAISQHPNPSASTISQISSAATLTSPSVFTSTPSESIHATTANVNNHASNVNLTTNIPHLATMHSNLSNISTSNVQHISAPNETTMSLSHVSSLSSSQSTGFQPQRQYPQGINPGLSSSVTLTGTTQPSNVVSTMNTVKSMQNIQSQNISSPGSPFSMPLKSPASNIAPPTPSPSPNRLLLRSPASNSIQSNRNSPSPVGTSTSNNNFNIQMQSPMQSPMSQIQSPVLSPYPPAKSPHLLSGNNSLNNRSPAPGGSPGPPVVRPNTPILQQGMQVLQIIHGTPQGYQSTPTQLVTRHLFGNQQIQIATPPKTAKQPQQILPKPPNQQVATSQQKPQRTTTTITNQVTQQTQPQLVLAGPQPSPTTATMIPTAQGLLLNQVLPSTGPVIVQQQPGGVQLILRTPANAQQQTHTTQLTQQQLVRVVTAQGMQLQGLAPTFFAVPNGFPPAASPVIRHTPSSPAPSNSGTGSSIVIQNAMVPSPQPQISQVTSAGNATGNASCTQTVVDQSLLPPPKKKAKKKKKAKRKDDEPPKLDLASIMKISGIGDDDDIFDTDLTAEAEVPCQTPQSESNAVISLGQLPSQGTVPPASSTQSLTQVPASNTTNTTQAASVSQAFNSQLVAQLQMPVQNTISGHLRLSVGEDGKVVLHHTPEPNQPEMDQATAQALIRSLTQGGGQNSQIISQLFGQTSTTAPPQSTQSAGPQRQKYAKSSTNTVSSTCSQNVTCATSPHHGQICSKPINQQQQKSTGVPQETANSLPGICVQNNLGSLEIQTSKGNVPSLMQGKNIQSLNASMTVSDVMSSVKPSPGAATFAIQGPRMASVSQASSNQANSNVSLQKSSQVRLTNACITTNVRQTPLGNKQSQQHAHVQKTLPSVVSSTTMQTDHMSKVNQNLQQTGQQESMTALQQDSPMFAQHNQQQITAQTVQTQNVQQIFEQNLQSSGSNIHHNSMNMLQQQQTSCNTLQHDTMNVLQHSSIQQNTINVLQQNTAGGGVSGIEPSLQSGIGDMVGHAPQNVMTSLQQQQQNTSAVLHNAQQQKVVSANTFSSVNAHHFESQNNSQAANMVQQGTNTPPNQNILITTGPTSNSASQQPNESQKAETAGGASMLNSAANNILNNAPKISPEILNALSNLNPNDQLLIANANGQMQVISQQLLQQFLAGQLNQSSQTPSQNQTQKIVIGEPDASNQNLQGVQINTPTSQIIVNSSGGAPTIQNNIQNIVVQAAPSQMPHHIQIQNSSFPSQFIDNLNQQQIRNLGNSNQPKKTKVVKRKVATSTQSVASQASKTVTVTRPTMGTSASNLQKIDHLNKPNIAVSSQSSTNPVKSESAQIISNGPLVTSAAGGHVSVPSNGQMVQRVQTIQLPAQKQQMLKNIQLQIQALQSRKSSGGQCDPAVLSKLYEEQTKIIASGKVLSTTTHSVNRASETSFNVNAASTVASGVHLQNSFKNQTSAVQTQTQTTAAAIPVTSQSLNPAAVSVPSNLNHSYTNNNITVPPSAAGQPAMMNTATQSIHQTHTKQQQQQQPHKFYQNHGNQILNPSSATNMQIFSPPISATAAPQLQSNAQQQQQLASSVQTQQPTGLQQQSTQCQTDPLDIKASMQATPSPAKQELPSPIQVQVQTSSPASQVTSPRMMSKGTQQRIQSPVNTGGNATKQLVSPSSSPLISPRQGVKRPATSPICNRQLNRGDLMDQQLKMDQNGATNPDMNTPFLSKGDACKRLVRYHCMNEQVLSRKDLDYADEIFEETAKHLLSKFNAMMNKYTYLLLMESTREVKTSELMMIDRTFVAEEQNILNRLREQEAKVNEEFKKEEKPLVPKVEPGLMEEDRLATSPPLVSVSVKRELEDDFPSDEMECKPSIKTSSSTSGDYDEWLEIQKELGVYPSTADTLKCKNGNNSGVGNNSGAVVAGAKSSKIERTRANGECRGSVANASVVTGAASNAVMKDSCEQPESAPSFEKRWSSATDLERDLLEDTDSLDGLALHSQTQCPGTVHASNDSSGNAGNEHDDITAQVQSAIDSILNLKKRPANTLSGGGGNSSSGAGAGGNASQPGDSKDTALDQAVRSILGS